MIKRLAQYLGQYKRDAALAPFFVVLESIIEVIIPLLVAVVIDRGITPGEIGVIRRLGVVLVCCTLVSLTCGVLCGRYAARASVGFAKNLRRAMYHNVQDFSFSNIDKFSSSGLVTRLTTDVTNVQNAAQMMMRVLMRSPAMLFFSLAMAFRIHPRLALIYLVAIPILGIGLYLIMTKAHPVFERVFKQYDKMNSVVQENLRGIRVVKSYVREDYEVKKFGDASQDIYKSFSYAEKLLAFNGPLMMLVVNSCMLLIAWFGAQIIVAGGMTTGNLTSLLTYTMQILMSLMMLSMVFVMLTISRASAERIIEVLDETSDLRSPAENAVAAVADGSVRFEGVNFSYGGEQEGLALREIDLDIPSGQTVGIIGGTGSGKTSLVQLIPRLYDASRGRVLVGGVDVRDYDLDALRSQVAVVLQKNELFSGTIKENLRWGNEHASDEELVHACRLAQADEFVRSFPDGYDTYIEQGGTNVSGGQKQRLCIARALLAKPKVLILDDSTSAVDTKTDASIRRAFLEEIPDTTKIIIAQRIASVQEADQILVLDDGKIVAHGSHEQLMESSEIYREVYTSQIKGGEDDGAA